MHKVISNPGNGGNNILCLKTNLWFRKKYITVAEFRNQKEFKPQTSQTIKCAFSLHKQPRERHSFPFGMNEIVTMSRGRQIAYIQFNNYFLIHTMS